MQAMQAVKRNNSLFRLVGRRRAVQPLALPLESPHPQLTPDWLTLQTCQYQSLSSRPCGAPPQLPPRKKKGDCSGYWLALWMKFKGPGSDILLTIEPMTGWRWRLSLRHCLRSR